MDYAELKKQTNRGWNTWNTRSVMSHVYLPYGFMINLCIKEYSQTDVLREALVGRFPREDGNSAEVIFPGVRSWDGAYTSFDMDYAHIRLRVESAVLEDQQYILVTPLANTGRRPATLIVEACLIWGREGSVSKKDGRLLGEFADGKKIEIFTSGKTGNEAYTYSLSPSFSVSLTEPVAVATVPCTVEKTREILDRARAQVEQQAHRFGENEELYTAMKTCLAWDTVYDCEHDRVCSPVSRIWNCGWGGYVLFDWDTYFAALMAAVDNPELAYLNAIAITREGDDLGFVPNAGAAHDYKSRDRSEPPVGAVVTLEIYRKYRQDWFVREIYPALRDWNQWYFDHRSTEEGYMCWGSDWYQDRSGKYFETHTVGDLQGAADESGLDNSPMYDDAVYDPEKGWMMQADVGLMGMFVKDCACLMELARAIGAEEDIPAIQARMDKVDNGLMQLWSREDGIFENLDLVKGKLSRHISPTNFYALFSKKVTPEQKQSMVQRYFYNPEEFWGEYMIPSISRRDPGYQDQAYWRGRIWGPMNLLTYWALKDGGLDREAAVLAEKSRNLLLKEWREHGHVHENYNADTGEGCDSRSSDKFYHWGGLLGYISMQEAENR